MKCYEPMYYKKFHCIADKCKHNCCIGWDVEIDEYAYERFMSLKSPLGEKIRSNIYCDEDLHYFKMRKDGRCPFLGDDNLCEIIKDGGEEALCDICHEHPRFYNYFDVTHRKESFLGLCCEEAARIILTEKEPFSMEFVSEDGINFWFGDDDSDDILITSLRDKLISIIEENDSLSEKLNRILNGIDGVSYPLLPDKDDIFDLLAPLERLDHEFDNTLALIKDGDNGEIIDDERYSLYFENLAKYFINRHLPSAIYCDENFLNVSITTRLFFAYVSVMAIAIICEGKIKKDGELTEEFIIETARAYSAEIEYSDKNPRIIYEEALEYVCENDEEE